MRKIMVMLLGGIFLICSTCLASTVFVAGNKIPIRDQEGQDVSKAVNAELAKLKGLALTDMVSVTMPDGKEVQMTVADCRTSLEALLNKRICRDFRVVGTPALGVERGNPTQGVITAKFQQIDTKGNPIETPVDDTIRFQDADKPAVAASVGQLIAALPTDLQAKLTPEVVKKTLGKAVILEDNRKGWMGGRQEGMTQVANSIADLPLTWLHEVLEGGVLSEAELLGQLEENQPVDATNRTFRDYVTQHGNTAEARLHGAAMAFAQRFFPQQHAELTVRIQAAMAEFAAKRPVREILAQKITETKNKMAFQFILPQKNTNLGTENCDTVQNISDVTTFEKSALCTTVQDVVRLAREALGRGVIPLIVLNSEMEKQIDTLSKEDREFLTAAVWLQGDKLNHKIGGKPVFDMMAGALLKEWAGTQTTDAAKKKVIANGLAIELSALRSDTAQELTIDKALELFPVPGDINALGRKRAVLSVLGILAEKRPERWIIDLQMILAIRSVDLAA